MSAPKPAEVCVVIPGWNASRTVEACLDALIPYLHRGWLEEILFVDDGSTDDTAERVAQYPVRLIQGKGEGPASARNLGIESSTSPLIWFIDSDCVAEPDALERLLPHLDDPDVAAVSGSYGNMDPGSLLGSLIHEEIVERHLSMPNRVNFLATFNVIYRRATIQEVGNFNERFITGEDAELSWRVLAAGHQLAFDQRSRVKHFHPVNWWPYLQKQRTHGYWRVFLHLSHKGHAGGDSYSRLLDHLQPPLAMIVLATLPSLLLPGWRWLPPGLILLLIAMAVPMTTKIVQRTQDKRYLAYLAMSPLRAFWRGLGMAGGILAWLGAGVRRAIR